jgi:hypothetical protein
VVTGFFFVDVAKVATVKLPGGTIQNPPEGPRLLKVRPVADSQLGILGPYSIVSSVIDVSIDPPVSNFANNPELSFSVPNYLVCLLSFFFFAEKGFRF